METANFLLLHQFVWLSVVVYSYDDGKAGVTHLIA
jgi:hypothetical protein